MSTVRALSLALAVTFVLISATSAPAAIIVVDQANPAADDTGPGSEAKPLKTIARAAELAKPGDTVCVMQGIYAERPALKTSGTAAAPITFRALPARSVTILGVDISASHIRLEGFHITNEEPASRTPGIALARGAQDLVVSGNMVEGIYNGLSGDATQVRLLHNHFYRNQYSILAGSPSVDWVIQGNQLQRVFQHRSGDCDYTRMWGHDHLFLRNRFHDTRREEIGKAHLDCVQSFNVKENNPDTFLHHLAFEENFCSTFSQAFMMSTSTPGTHHHLSFSRNIFWAGDAWGVCLSKLPDMSADHNTFATIKWFGFGNAGGERGSCTNNIFVGIATPYVMGPEPTVKGDLIFDCKVKPAAGGFVEADPKFADLAKGNLRLTAGSPAIDAAADKSDIGALEYPNVYYVDPDHPGASDDGFGYPGWPFKTLARAVAAAAPGETIVLCAGAYRESVAPKAADLTIRADRLRGKDGFASVVISGADLVADWTRGDDGSWSAPLAAAPAKLLCDGKPLADFSYDASARRLTVRGFDPRIHPVETVVRPAGIDASGAKNLKIQGVQTTNLLAK